MDARIILKYVKKSIRAWEYELNSSDTFHSMISWDPWHAYNQIFSG
jgi:hypothetical protein